MLIFLLYFIIQTLRKLRYHTSRKNFAEEFKIWLDTNQKIIFLDHQNNFVETSKIMNNAKNFVILPTNSSVLHNYFDSSIKFSDLYLAKILNLSVKSFFLFIDTLFIFNFLITDIIFFSKSK